MCIATLANLLGALRNRRKASFVSKAEIKMVFAIFLPTLVYLAVMQFVGLYVSIGHIHCRLHALARQVQLVKSCLTGLIVSVVLFAMF
jgi:hypothetical protein